MVNTKYITFFKKLYLCITNYEGLIKLHNFMKNILKLND